ncbi:branched-chain amino acid ABC transporter permease (plasmid) [Azospirillum baldaniorum]|uniref:ABC tranpsorter, permease protein (N-ter) and ATP-binding protein (C-ter) branched-chain amino acid transport protein n=1 Tax=Azospirillum baldaniorum TaxID=1064539 RepID=A0A9P1JYY3_9PROT|nr:branched-chain amino acid ABC transporter ATP-binding protein/permease [Azospirillum baldaniorum]AWJ93043.1 branched-chain amino acid ABC transporter permease [Azospirillum baldaniorum]TWA76191.1 amino acid/amide ABC transporter membrane protein 2 (HAAT family) /amino acid/amide ABC transporter ATP-binding protein 1 (HAAT family) [Azospirillum brasilense]CCD02370.1 putative ABC tranpsorter, permease protein (N-ter) and ATP-binding protein (C-ter); branched-chain amino acid transport protein [
MEYLAHILVMVCLYGILATSFNLLIGFGGIFALAHATFYASGAYAAGILATKLGIGFPLTLLAGMVVTAGIGLLVAFPAMRVGSHYLVVITLALQAITIDVLMNSKPLTGGPDGIAGIPPVSLFGTALTSPVTFLPLAVVMAALCCAVAWRLGASPFGRSLRAMRENEAAAQAVGKNLVRMKLVVFAMSAGLASVAGTLVAHYIAFVNPESFTIEETILILAMVILGGMGNLWGSLAGAAILVLLPEGLKFVHVPGDIADMVRQVIYGVVLIVILRLRTEGLFPETVFRTPTGAARSSVPANGQLMGALERAGGTPGEVVVSATSLSKHFGGIQAVKDLTIDLKRGEIVGLIGPNGAGKTTAFNLLSGFLRPTGGTILYRGRDMTTLKPHEVVAAGLARSFQDLKLFTKLTVVENILVSLPAQPGDRPLDVYFRPGLVRRADRENVARALEIASFVGLLAKADETAANLSYAEEKLLVIARLLATGADVLLLDEPLSGLDTVTVERICGVIRDLARANKAVCIIEHNLEVIRGVCDEIVFIDEGRVLTKGPPDTLMRDRELAERYFG